MLKKSTRTTKPAAPSDRAVPKVLVRRAAAAVVNPWFELRKSAIQGRGGFALKRIPKGTRLIEYLGERISRDEADTRYDDSAMSRHHTFLFTVDDRTVIDAAVDGNEARFLNHSCDPNCQAVLERKRIFIEALKPIAAGAELVYDYAYERQPDHTAEDELMYACRCGAATCRGSILAPPAPPKGRRTAAAKNAAAKNAAAKKAGAKKSGAKTGARSKGASTSKATTNSRAPTKTRLGTKKKPAPRR